MANTVIIPGSDQFRTQPANRNLLSPLGYQLTFVRLPNLVYFLQAVKLPSVSIGSTRTGTPMADIVSAGDHAQYGHWPFSFAMDEDMATYYEMLLWMQGLAPPYELGSTESLNVNNPLNNMKGMGRTSDAYLTVLTSENLPNIRFKFYQATPIYLDEVDFDTTKEGPDPIVVSVVMEYSRFTWDPL